MENKKDYSQYAAYKCYSPKMKWYMLNQGIQYICVANDCTTGAKFWLFLRDDKFNKALDEYKPYEEVR